jgi:tight adherence protein B
MTALVLVLLLAAALLAAYAAAPPTPASTRQAPAGAGPAVAGTRQAPAGAGPAVADARRALASARSEPASRPAWATGLAPAGRSGGLRPGGLRPGGLRPGLDRLAGRLPVPGRAARHRGELEAAVPEVLDVLRATIAAGIAPHMALRAAAEGAPPPLAEPLGDAVRLTGVGSGAGRALAMAATAAGLPELLVAGEALDLAETTGAPPGPVLAGVAGAAADRVRARQARMAATAQARLSARVVAAMAPAFLAVLAVTSPSDAAFLVRDPLGWAALAAAIAFEAAGIHWSARIVRSPAP